MNQILKSVHFNKLLRISFVSSLAMTGLLSQTVFANLIVNGGFEAGLGGYAEIAGGSNLIPGWTTTQSGVEYFTPAAYGYGSAPEGLGVVDLANYVYTGGGIQQSFATTAGNSYTLNFSGGNFVVAGRDGTGIIDVLLNGTLAQSFLTASTSTTTIEWKVFSLNFIATGASTTLEFQNNQNPYTHFAQLDKLIVEESTSSVPEPNTLLLLGMGILILGSFTVNRVAKQPLV